jgi:photosystem II CP47 chlorophyll apoprotein
MLLYEILLLDTSDPILNPLWRQGTFVLPYVVRLGLAKSQFNWGLFPGNPPVWRLEFVLISHILLAGLLILASFWHWAYWDLDLFLVGSRLLLIDLFSVFGIHLSLAASVCFSFGLFHFTGLFGPGILTSDSAALIGGIRWVKPAFTLLNLGPFAYSSLPAHHIGAGLLGIFLGPWHILGRPGPSIFKSLKANSIESALSSSISAVFFSAFLTAALVWYSTGATSGAEILGPSRFQWDSAYYQQIIESRGSETSPKSPNFGYFGFENVPDKLVFYDYLGVNPSKGGLFRAGPMLKGDGLPDAYTGKPAFYLGSLALAPRRSPAFFEGFPVLLLDPGGRLRADIPFRRSESVWSLEQVPVVLGFRGGLLGGSVFSKPSQVKTYARKSVSGEIFNFERGRGVLSDGCFRTSSRGWYTFAHVSLAFLFFFGHLWHASRCLFADIWAGIRGKALETAEYGSNELLGDLSTRSSAYI